MEDLPLTKDDLTVVSIFQKVIGCATADVGYSHGKGQKTLRTHEIGAKAESGPTC